MEEIFILIVGFGVLVAGLILFAFLYKMAEVRRARNWLSTAGRVTKSQVRNRKRTDRDGKSSFESEPWVTYEYVVSGKTYHGSRISFAERISGADVQAMLKRYPVSSSVTVYYNPNNPGEAVLERVMPEVVKQGAGGLGAFFLGAAVVIPLAISFASRWLAPRIPNPEQALLVVLLIGIGLALLLFIFVLLRQVAASRKWESTQGKLLSATAEEYTEWVTIHGRTQRRRMFRPLVIYMFFVNGQRYIRTRTHFGIEVSWSIPGQLRSFLRKYPEDSEVTVYYDPLNPEESVLERRAAGAPLLAVVSIMFFILAAFVSGVI